MANWKEYTTKTTPEDADEIMIADSKANVSKRTPFSGLWNWIAGKLATAVISQLETQNKSIIPALNELNSKTKISVISPEVFESGEKTRSYKLSPLVLDQSILCICRSEIYLITLAKSTTIFNGCGMNKVFDAVSVRDASVKLAENQKDIIFTCALFENPVFIGKFKFPSLPI